MSEQQVEILVKEDDLIDRMAFERAIQSQGLSYQYTMVGSVAEATEKLSGNDYQIIISDHELGDGNAFEILKLIDNTPLIFVTGAGDEELAVNAMKAGASDYLIKDPEHNYLRVLPITIDNCLKRHNSQQKLKASEERYRQVVEGTLDLIQSVDENGKFLYVNNAWKDSLGYTDDEITSLGLFDIIHPEDQEHCKAIFHDITINKKPIAKLETSFITKGGKKLIVSGNTFMNNENGKITTRSIFHDITDKIRAEKILKQANADLEKIVQERTIKLRETNENLRREIEDRKKTEHELIQINEELNTFIYKTSHDIRGPLSSIMGLLGIAQMEGEKEEQYLDLIVERIDHLDHILGELINVSKIRQGKPENIKIHFDKIINEILKSLDHHPGFERIKTNININLTKPYYSDPQIIATIFQNLIINSVKYQDADTPSPFLNINISSSSGSILIELEDNGVGIDKEIRPKVFEMFYRGTTLSEGSGLGLYIVQKGVEKLGGTINISDGKDNTGITVSITLPQVITERKGATKKADLSHS